MSYTKMMKWNSKHHKGISYKRSYMGFNPSGITSEQIDERSRKFISEMKKKTLSERKKYWDSVNEILKIWEHSWDWEWCVFQRNFTYQNEVIC